MHVVAVVKCPELRGDRRFKISFDMDRDQFFEWHLTEGDDVIIEVGKLKSVACYRGGEFEYYQHDPQSTIRFDHLQDALAACSEL